MHSLRACNRWCAVLYRLRGTRDEVTKYIQLWLMTLRLAGAVLGGRLAGDRAGELCCLLRD